MAALSSQLRGILEKAVLAGRAASETAADAALNTLGLTTSQSYATLTSEQRRLRVALRARARQLGDGSVEGGRHLLVEEIAYEQWNRMLFARFLAENGLLMHPSGVAVTLEECAELAPEGGEPDAWSLAARYASAMLPGIFRSDDPASQVRLAPEGRVALESIVAELPQPIFGADDALGWSYQFWQSRARDEISGSGRKVGAEELPAVTQLFTEDYMVRFLLENSLGAWWAGKHPESPLLKDFVHLRCKDDGTPAAGTFPGWPQVAAEVTVMDPCCGSGHFLVAAFEMLRRMRVEEEGLSEIEAGDAVLQVNLFGLEIDPRCTQIAAFVVAFAAWKAGGYRQLPPLNIACTGVPVKGQSEEWARLAGDDVNLQMTLERLYHLFHDAPTLGSLMNPADVPDPLFAPHYSVTEPILQRALADGSVPDPVAQVFGASAKGAVRAAILLAGTYTFVATNVPYLTRSKQGETLRKYCEARHRDAQGDLATAFLDRCRSFSALGGAYATVTPQNWLFLGSYTRFRMRLLREQEWKHVSLVGSGATAKASWEVARTLSVITNAVPTPNHRVTGIDASMPNTAEQRMALLLSGPILETLQAAQLRNPDARIVLGSDFSGTLLEAYARSYKGITTGDDPRFRRVFWEREVLPTGWRFLQTTVDSTCAYGGLEHCVWMDAMVRPPQSGVFMRGTEAWGRLGVAVSQMKHLPVALYSGEPFDTNVAMLVPFKVEHLRPIWAFCFSPEFSAMVREIDRSLKVTNATLAKVPFDLEHWQKVAEESAPLPEPHSTDPSQWIFKGDPADSSQPLQVAVARLLGYHWPGQNCDRLDTYADDDGIVCLPPVAGEQPAAERLRALLAAAYADTWSTAKRDQLLAQPAYAGKDLQEWLRDGFFSQHGKLFRNRPFIWHIWDGRSDGFAALVNYHKLDAAGLNRLIYTYVGSWIETQRAAQARGEAGADGRLVAALEMQRKLQLIAEGEPPYDVYVRWKPLHEQPIGWNPDLNDGVRLNIRPFVTAGVLRSKFTVNWNKDRGANPDGSERLNDLHLTNVEKRAARDVAGVR